MTISVTELDACTAVGVRWKGSFKQAQAGEIKSFMQQFRERLVELPASVDKTTILGVSSDISSDGFTYYLCCKELEPIEQLPKGMERITVPDLTVVTYEHKPEEVVQESYTKVYEWIAVNDYHVHDDIKIEHVEIYPSDYHPINEPPRLTITIPIKK